MPGGSSVGQELRSPKERAGAAATDPDLADLVGGNSAFAFDLYRTLATEDGNLFYSPYSISLALAMTYAGARGETERQMAETLRFRLPQERLHPTFNALDLQLASRGDGARGEDDEGFRLNIANAVWGQEDYGFLDAFLDVLAESYGAGVRPMNFREAPEESRVRINDWIAEQTEDRIKDLIPGGVIDDLTRMVLTNAIYFNAGWNHPFNKAATVPRTFHLLDGTEVEVPMMSQTARYGYTRGDGYQAVELSYRGRDMAMTILLPDQGGLRGFEESLDDAYVSRIVEDIEPRRVLLTIPKFEYESQFGLVDTLKSMGMENAFDARRSDFSGIDGRSCIEDGVPCLLISDVVHKAFVLVDEEGTEAAAATGVVVILESEPITVTVDRPFIFLIRDIETGTVLFVGRVVDPRS